MDEEILKEFNNQINEEIYSAYLYLAMAANFEAQNLNGFAHWMELQAKEEMEHAMKFYKHILERGNEVELQKIKKPKTDFKTPLQAFEAAYKHEQHITGRIHFLLELSRQETDYPAESMLQWFVDEQVEEESNTSEITEKLKQIKNSKNGLFMMNKVLGERK